MPTYDYQCKACDHAFEAFQAMSANPLKKCPSCGKQQLKRLIGTGAGVIFKGSGFYETDYRSQSYTKAAEAEKGGGESKGDSSAKTDSKGGGDSTGSSSETSTAAKSDKPAKSSGSSTAKSGSE